MWLRVIVFVLGLVSVSAVAAETPPTQMPPFARSGYTFTQPVVIYGPDGNIISSFGGSGAPTSITGSHEQDVRSSGTLNAASTASTIVIPINGQATVGLTFAGLTASGATVTFEQSNDNATTWTGVNEVNAGTGVPSATRTTDGQTRVAVQGRTNLRLRISTAGTGTIGVAWNVSVREGLVTLASPLPPGTNSIGIVTVGNPGIVGVTRTRLTCTLPAYAAGGNVVCTDQAGQQTTTACAANTACLISTANANRKVAEFTNRTAGTTIDLGYAATVSPGTGKGYDGPSTTNGQGGSGSENPAHVGSYFAATATAGAVLVFVQGQ